MTTTPKSYPSATVPACAPAKANQRPIALCSLVSAMVVLTLVTSWALFPTDVLAQSGDKPAGQDTHSAPPGVTPSRKVTLNVAALADAPAYVTPVAGRGSNRVLVSVPAGKLVFTYSATNMLSFVPLDAKGLPVPKAKAVKFTLPDNGLGKDFNDWVTSIACHPTKPILYVWRDLALYRYKIVIPKNDKLQYDHLLVFDISQDKPKLLMSTCRGSDFMIGRRYGSITLGNEGKRLFVPNLVYKPHKGYGVALGYYQVDANGLPILVGAEPEKNLTPLASSNITDAPPVVISDNEDLGDDDGLGELSDEPIAAGRGGGLTLLQMSRLSNRYSTGPAFYIDDDHTLVSYNIYLVAYDNANRAGRLDGVIIPGASAMTANPTIAPDRRHVYLALSNRSTVLVWALANSYPTLLPQMTSVPDRPRTSPALISSHSQLALNFQTTILLIQLDKQGWLTSKATQFKNAARHTSAMVYSPKFDRLYVANDTDQETAP